MEILQNTLEKGDERKWETYRGSKIRGNDDSSLSTWSHVSNSFLKSYIRKMHFSHFPLHSFPPLYGSFGGKRKTSKGWMLFVIQSARKLIILNLKFLTWNQCLSTHADFGRRTLQIGAVNTTARFVIANIVKYDLQGIL